MQVTIHPATPDDVPRLIELCSLLDLASEASLDVEQGRRQFTRLMSRPEHRIYVARHADEIVGTFALIFVGGIAHGGRDAAVIEDVAVATEAQGQGVGVAMMRFAMGECARRACYKLVLSSRVDRTRAHRFYERLGFRRHGFSFLIDGLDQTTLSE